MSQTGEFLQPEQIKTSSLVCYSLQYHPGALFSCAVCSTAHLFPPETGPQVLENTERRENERACVRDGEREGQSYEDGLN